MLTYYLLYIRKTNVPDTYYIKCFYCTFANNKKLYLIINEIKNVLSCAWLCKKKERYSTTINSDLPNEPVTFES